MNKARRNKLSFALSLPSWFNSSTLPCHSKYMVLIFFSEWVLHFSIAHIISKRILSAHFHCECSVIVVVRSDRKKENPALPHWSLLTLEVMRRDPRPFSSLLGALRVSSTEISIENQSTGEPNQKMMDLFWFKGKRAEPYPLRDLISRGKILELSLKN